MRVLESERETFGVLTYEQRLVACTLELPDKNNARNISSIPPGKYRATYREDGANGRCYELDGVEGRSHIQIHAGNTTRDIEGCILLGAASPFPEMGVWHSRRHLKRFLELAGGEPVVLHIQRARGV
jgi:hypothetical protein